MKYCKNCIIPDTKPGISLDKKGLCNACRNVNIKNNIDWNKRKRDLYKIIKKIKKENKEGAYDCIVPISSGGKDSCFQLHILVIKTTPYRISLIKGL